MSNDWENIVEYEIDFYLNYGKYRARLEDRLKENELDIQFPTTRFDSEQGRVYQICPSTEEQALKRIAVREAIYNILDKAEKRIQRLAGLFTLIGEHNKKVLHYCCFERDMSDFERIRHLGLKSVAQLQREKKKALQSLYRWYVLDREEREDEFREMLLAERKKKAEALKRTLMTS